MYITTRNTTFSHIHFVLFYNICIVLFYHLNLRYLLSCSMCILIRYNFNDNINIVLVVSFLFLYVHVLRRFYVNPCINIRHIILHHSNNNRLHGRNPPSALYSSWLPAPNSHQVRLARQCSTLCDSKLEGATARMLTSFFDPSGMLVYGCNT